MKTVNDILYFDEIKTSTGGIINYSFYLDLKRSKVVFGTECNNFLNKLKECILKEDEERLVTLSVYNVKLDFERIICLDILNLDFTGCIMDTSCYKIPNSLTIEEIDKVYDFNSVVSSLRQTPVKTVLEGYERDTLVNKSLEKWNKRKEK